MTEEIVGLILAAGKGTRMKSTRPKVLHTLAGRPMLEWVEDALVRAGVDRTCVVLSEELEGFRSFLAARPQLTVAIQKNRLGTGDAVAAAAHAFAGAPLAPYAAGRLAQGRPSAAASVLICAGDTPALDPAELSRFVAACQRAECAVGVLGMRPHDPTGYGRLVVEGESLARIVEERDADAATRKIDIVSSGIIYARSRDLFSLLGELKPANSQNEYYLTDIVSLARARGLKTLAHIAAEAHAFAGVNDRRQLAEVETLLVGRLLRSFMLEGVTIRSPATVYVEANVRIGTDSELEPGSVLRGLTDVAAGCHIGANVVLDNAEIGKGAKLGAGSIVKDAKVAPGEHLPPASVRIGKLS